MVGSEGLARERVVGDVGDEVDVERAEDGDSGASHGCWRIDDDDDAVSVVGVADVAAGDGTMSNNQGFSGYW